MITRARVTRFLSSIQDLRDSLAAIEKGEKKPSVMSALGHASTNLKLAGNAVIHAAEEKKK